jgi:hypothetical protein
VYLKELLYRPNPFGDTILLTCSNQKFLGMGVPQVNKKGAMVQDGFSLPFDKKHVQNKRILRINLFS